MNRGWKVLSTRSGGRFGCARFMVVDLVVLLAVLATLIVLAALWGSVPGPFPASQVHVVLTLAAAAAGAKAVVMADVVNRLSDDPRAAWVGAGTALYSVAVVPVTALGGPLASACLVGSIAVVLLLLMAQWRPPPLSPSRFWLLIGCGSLLIVLAAGLAALAPATAATVNSMILPKVAVVSGAGLSAIGVAAVACIARNAPFWRIGVGLGVMSGAQLYQLASGETVTRPDITFTSVRLLGMLLVLVGFTQLACRAWQARKAEFLEYEENLRVAEVNLRRTTEHFAEREHELRNGLAGLASLPIVLQSPSGVQHDDLQLLQSAFAAEVTRLDDLLRIPASSAGRSTSDARGHLVAPVLQQLVALRRVRGMAIELDVDPPLRMRPEPTVLAQVMTNLLANCERHAPGAPVFVQAGRWQDRVRVQVRDLGPGLPPGTDLSAFGRGGPSISCTSGSGLGLSITRQLLVAHDGEIRVVASPPGRGGLILVVELPAADDAVAVDQCRGSRCLDHSGTGQE